MREVDKEEEHKVVVGEKLLIIFSTSIPKTGSFVGTWMISSCYLVLEKRHKV